MGDGSYGPLGRRTTRTVPHDPPGVILSGAKDLFCCEFRSFKGSPCVVFPLREALKTLRLRVSHARKTSQCARFQ